MVKLSKCKKLLQEYKNAILCGSIALLGALALVSTIHHAITLFTIVCLVGVCFYVLWSNSK
jgi:hypothetical protein